MILTVCISLMISITAVQAHHNSSGGNNIKHNNKNAPIKASKSIKQIVAILTEQGFSNISKIKLDHDQNTYKIKAQNSHQKDVDIRMTTSGRFITIERD